MVVPSPPRPPARPVQPLSKDSLRSAALDARKAFARTLGDAGRTILEERLAEHLTGICASARVVAGYAAFGSEISPLLAMEEARSVGAIVAFPAFGNPAKPFQFRAGDPTVPGPFGIMQPAPTAPVVEPDLVLVPLIAVDPHGARIGRGKGHYDRVLARMKRSGVRLVGVGWRMQRLDDTFPADPWDVRLDAFASPEGIEWFNRSARTH
ncbi:MAG TPA: 5-formyltetrahydrofolate cyclo-ligase [Sphingomicrobium sp.]|nr:5-formyltetrahydrofolate cyclo-ligase [Sphingomicrobium sp.]